MTTDQDVVLHILESDRQALDLFQAALNNRNKFLNQQHSLVVQSSYYVGDRVQLFNISPKYMNGKIGVINAIGSDYILVEFDNPITRAGKTMWRTRVPFSCVKKV
jgi:hypothetical protein